MIQIPAPSASSAIDEALFTAEFPVPGIALVRIKRHYTEHLSLLDDKVSYLRFLDRCATDHELKCVILLGNPEKRGQAEFTEWRQRMSGDHAAIDLVRKVVNAFQQSVLRVLQLPQITIYADAGNITPNYLSIALAADYFYVGDKARLQNPNASCDLLPAGGATFLLRQRMNRPQAYALLTSPDEKTATEMAEIGLCDGVLPEAEMEEKLLAKARELIQHRASYLRAIKISQRPDLEKLAAWLEYELKVIQRDTRTDDRV